MQETYQKAIAQILKDEGGYTNNPADPGGPTNWGITLHDAQMYWKADATAEDVKAMPESVAENIYLKHYAEAVNYNSLPAGVDYAVLDYAVNSGVSRSLDTLKIANLKYSKPEDIINYIYDERLHFLEGLSTFKVFGKGWTVRCVRGRALALSLVPTESKPAPQPSVGFWQAIINFFTKGKQ